SMPTCYRKKPRAFPNKKNPCKCSFECIWSSRVEMKIPVKQMQKQTEYYLSSHVCGYPLSIFIIVVNEFCERFSYYGMRAVLVLYFKYFLRWDDDTATAIYHSFVAVCYLTPIFGAIIADSWLGKFKTIFSLSIVYTIGQAVMAVKSPGPCHGRVKVYDCIKHKVFICFRALSMIGLLLIAIGTGGIKPCVSAFGGDQFEDNQQRSRFFSIFYLSINAGSLLSTVITPILRGMNGRVTCTHSLIPGQFGISTQPCDMEEKLENSKEDPWKHRQNV
uniref:Solute carrier family 15 member 1 n=1 Tax=Erpetoichthys calabaricus TaxID=27687 RepID=A0A8C4RKN4_ERPCA